MSRKVITVSSGGNYKCLEDWVVVEDSTNASTVRMSESTIAPLPRGGMNPSDPSRKLKGSIRPTQVGVENPPFVKKSARKK